MAVRGRDGLSMMDGLCEEKGFRDLLANSAEGVGKDFMKLFGR